jgi:hypothetical protein
MRFRQHVFAVLALSAACSPPNTGEFGPPKQLRKDQRPTVWDAPAKDRLGLPEMGPAAGGGSAGAGGAAGAAAKVWVGDTPAGWETRPTRQFRDAVWAIPSAPDAEVYLTVGVGGGVAGNLARWYTQQFGLAQVPAVEALPVVELAGKPARLADLKGTFGGKAGWGALIAFYAEGDSVTSFKFTGPAAVVDGNRDTFLALAKSLRAATASPDPKAPPIQPGQPMPSTHPDVGQQPGATPPAGAPAAVATGPIAASAPAGWRPKAGSSKWHHHDFGAGAEVYVSQLGGGLKDTLDIWRGEMGQAPLAADAFASLPRTVFLGDDAVLLDLAGDFRSFSGKQIQGARMLVAAREENGAITFAKLVGPAADVGAAAAEFAAFCRSARKAQ